MANPYLKQVSDASSEKLKDLIQALGAAQSEMGTSGTIFATGSYGRLEAGPESDIDVFFVVRSVDSDDGKKTKPALNEIKQILCKAELIKAVKHAGIADFDAGGKFLVTHLFDEILNEAGSPSDDFKNTFTGRMLLILESRPLVGIEVYKDLRRQAIDVYFRDYVGNEDNFVPYFLANDMLRMWRTFCVNYEHFRGNTSDWRVKNLKLKYTRILTVFSALIFISAKFLVRGSVRPDDIEEMSDLTPIERLEKVAALESDFKALRDLNGLPELICELVDDYGEFHELVQEKKLAIKALKNDEDEWRERSYRFGAKIAKLLRILAGNEEMENRFYRSLIV